MSDKVYYGSSPLCLAVKAVFAAVAAAAYEKRYPDARTVCNIKFFKRCIIHCKTPNKHKYGTALCTAPYGLIIKDVKLFP